MSKLYEIANNYAEIMDSDMDPELLRDTIEGIEGEFEDKVENILMLIKNERVYSQALKDEAKSFAERARIADNKVEQLTAYLISALNTAGLKSVKAGLQSVTVRAATKTVDVVDFNKIPVDYVDFETVVKPDKLAIKKLLEAGQEVPGCELKTGKQSLLIK